MTATSTISPGAAAATSAANACCACVWVKGGENISLGGLWLEDHDLSVASEKLGLPSRAAPSLRTHVVKRGESGG